MFTPLPYLMMPLKPMNAMDISPAVISAMGSPFRDSGMPSFVSMRSRMPAISEMARRKPSEEPSALTRAKGRL